MFYVYIHCKPDGMPFYVGKGSGNRANVLGGRTRNTHYKNIVSKYGKDSIIAEGQRARHAKRKLEKEFI